MLTKQIIIPPLTGIRAIAAFSVFFYHFNLQNKTSLLFPYLNVLHIGVDFFFVLSGFLIAYRYYDTYTFNRKWISTYIVNRVARIYPMYFLLTLLTFFVSFLLQINSSDYTFIQIARNTFFNFFMNITFLRGFFNDLKFSGIPQGWTLTVEECFYFSAPVIFLLSKKFTLWFQPIILLLVGFIIVFTFGTTSHYGFFSNSNFMMNFTIFGKSFEFFLGIFLAKSILKEDNALFKPRNVTWISTFLVITFIFIVAIFNKNITPTYYIVLQNFILPIFICGLLFGLIKEKTIISKLLSTKLFIVLGKSSYIFYLIHLGVIQLFISKFISENIFTNFIILNIIAFLLFKFIEEPLNLNIRQYFLKKSKTNRFTN